MTIPRGGQFRSCRGLSLGEMLAALVIGALVLTAILGIYGRANQAAESVRAKIETPVMATEVLQLIARDVDRIMETSDIEVQVQNGYDNGYPSAQLVLRRTYRDIKNEKQTLEEITWRSAYDYDSPDPGLVLYRGHEGIGLEDKLLDTQRADWETNYPYVPVCTGVTSFEIEVPKGEGVVRVWPSGAPPTAVKVTISFGDVYEETDGALEVPEAEKVTRTMAIDKTRTIQFVMAGQGDAEGQGGTTEEGLKDDTATGEEKQADSGTRQPTTTRPSTSAGTSPGGSSRSSGASRGSNSRGTTRSRSR